MSYVLGSETESMTFTTDGIEYRPLASRTLLTCSLRSTARTQSWPTRSAATPYAPGQTSGSTAQHAVYTSNARLQPAAT
jgi:hypothetical protein